jgi:hypothetical protein
MQTDHARNNKRTCLEKADSDGGSDAGGAKGPLVALYRLRIALELLNDCLQRELALRQGQDEAATDKRKQKPERFQEAVCTHKQTNTYTHTQRERERLCIDAPVLGGKLSRCGGSGTSCSFSQTTVYKKARPVAEKLITSQEKKKKEKIEKHR